MQFIPPAWDEYFPAAHKEQAVKEKESEEREEE
jgi:hypothetical protein